MSRDWHRRVALAETPAIKFCQRTHRMSLFPFQVRLQREVFALVKHLPGGIGARGAPRIAKGSSPGACPTRLDGFVAELLAMTVFIQGNVGFTA